MSVLIYLLVSREYISIITYVISYISLCVLHSNTMESLYIYSYEAKDLHLGSSRKGKLLWQNI
jgi:hypothetical protein